MGHISSVTIRNPVCQEPLTSDQKLSGVKRQNSPVVVQSCSPTTETKNILQKVKMIGFKCFGLSSTRWVWMWELNPYLRPDRLVAFIAHEARLFVFEPHASQHAIRNVKYWNHWFISNLTPVENYFYVYCPLLYDNASLFFQKTCSDQNLI